MHTLSSHGFPLSTLTCLAFTALKYIFVHLCFLFLPKKRLNKTISKVTLNRTFYVYFKYNQFYF